MGMYTEFHFNIKLKKDVPEIVINILKYMLNQIVEKPQLPEHPLFHTDRWQIMLRMDSYYFKADTHSTLRYDEYSKTYYLGIRCNLKNYNEEIEYFVSWIMPYIDAYEGDFLGFSRYEETNQPTLIFAIGVE